MLKNIKRVVTLGAVLVGFAVSPVCADEVANLENDTTIEVSMESIKNDLEGKVFSSKEELASFCEANGYKYTRNRDKDSVNGESHFIVFICGNSIKAEVTVEAPKAEDTFEPVLDGTNNDNMMVTPEVEDTFEPVLDGTEEDNMMVTPEVEDTFEPVLDGTEEDNMMVTPEVEVEDAPVVEEVQPEVEETPEVLGTEEESVEEDAVQNEFDYSINPKTGDASVVVYAIVALLSVVGLALTRKLQ